MENAEQTGTARPPSGDDEIEAARKRIAVSNPGTELWLGKHPVTGDWWWYRGATKPESKGYKKKLDEQDAKGEMGDNDVAFEWLVYQAVLACSDGDGKDGLTKLLAKRPMLLAVMAGEVCGVSGFTQAAFRKKY